MSGLLFRLYIYYNNGLIFAKPIKKENLEKRSNGLFYIKKKKFAFTGEVKEFFISRNIKYFCVYKYGVKVYEEIYGNDGILLDLISYNEDGSVFAPFPVCTSKEQNIFEVRKKIREHEIATNMFVKYSVKLFIVLIFSYLWVMYIDKISGALFLGIILISSAYNISNGNID